MQLNWDKMSDRDKKSNSDGENIDPHPNDSYCLSSIDLIEMTQLWSC